MRKAIKAIIAVLCIVLCMSVFFACDPKTDPTPDPDPTPTPTPHTHSYTELKNDTVNHWYQCPEDGEKNADSIEAHYDADLNGKCDVCEYEMPVTAVKGLEFTIKGDNNGADESLNGVSVAIKSKTGEFTATIADGKFKVEDVVPFGTYTVSADGYYDEKITVAAESVPTSVVLFKVVNVATSVEIKEIDGVPTLVAEGMIPEIEGVTIGNVMLHFYEDKGADYFFSNTSKIKNAYHFEMAISEVPVKTNTPWCWFHIYPYAEENPTKDSTPLTTDGDLTNLLRGDKINVNDSVTCNEATFTVQDSEQLIIQAKALPKATVTSITFDISDGKAELVVKGTKLASVGDIKIHANANKVNEQETHFYGNNVSTEADKFECRFDFAEVVEAQLDDTPWCWFHIFTYNDANPSADKLADPDGRFDLERGDYLKVGDKVELNDITYEVQDNNQLVVQPKSPGATVTNVEVKTIEGKPYLVVTGTTSKAREGIKIHAVNGDNHYYSDAAQTTAGGTFELKFDITQMTATGDYYFHIYPNASNDNSDKAKVDVPRKNYLEAGATFDIGDLRYTIIEKDWDQVVVAVTNVPKTAVTSIAFDTTGDVPALVIKGTIADGVPGIKLHAWHEEGLYWNNLSTESGKMEFRVPVTDLTHVGNVSYFHTVTYDADATENQYGPEVNVARGDLIAAGTYVEHNGIRYWVKADEGLQVVPVSIESVAKLDITSVTIDTTDGLTLVVKGSTNQQIPCLKIHADGKGDNWYGEGVSVLTEGGGDFELKFDLTQLKTDGQPWCWFHIYAYADVNPTDNTSKEPANLTGDNWFIRGGESVTYNGVKYTVVSGDGTYGVFIIQPSVVTEA